jgi:hypothetical protein
VAVELLLFRPVHCCSHRDAKHLQRRVSGWRTPAAVTRSSAASDIKAPITAALSCASKPDSASLFLCFGPLSHVRLQATAHSSLRPTGSNAALNFCSLLSLYGKSVRVPFTALFSIERVFRAVGPLSLAGTIHCGTRSRPTQLPPNSNIQSNSPPVTSRKVT